MKHSYFKYLLSALLLATFLGCKKEKSQDELSPQEEMQIALAAVRGDAQIDFTREEVFDNVMGVNNEVGMGGTGVFGRQQQPDSLNCVSITLERLSPAPFPIRVTIDFGSGCVGRDGRSRSGQIITEYSGRLTEPGAEAKTTFAQYQIDSLAISGTQLVRNTSIPAPGPVLNRQFTITVTDGRIVRPSGNYVQWNGTRVLTQVEGGATPLHPVDDVFNITGGASGTLKTGNLISTWSSAITAPLRKSFNCHWIRKGIVETHRGTGSASAQWTGRLDYGAGNCDNSATLTLNNSTYQISLP
ncbi:MAG: hypothetical protein EOO15_21425 [Chitinophagaceae bacterium]|nr:MAG: hypothetical protein EOO15_21425 [Chitinophagaceae bacterium]